MSNGTLPELEQIYDAFLSYSHAADNRLAPAVQHCLHRLTKPWYRAPALRVFRDQASLAANPDLWATIHTALQQSRYFVLLASPEAAKSQWVQREISFWQDHRERETLLIVRTDGEIHWNRDSADFDWQRTTALPKQLAGWFVAEPLVVDLTWARTETQLSMRNPRFRDACGTLAATIHGIPKDKLESEDVRQHRIAMRLGTAIVVVLVLLLGLAGVAFHNADQQRQTAEQQRQTAEQQRTIAEQQRTIAEQQRTIATGRALQASAENLRESRPQTSLRLSLAALQVNPTPEARAGLVASLMQTHYAGESSGAGTSGTDTVDDDAVFSPDGRTLATAGHGKDNAVTLWDTTDPTAQLWLASLTGHTGKITDIAFSPDGRSLATGDTDGTVILWELGDRTRPQRAATMTGVTGVAAPRPPGGFENGPALGAAVAYSTDGRTLATVGRKDGADGTLILWDIGDRANPRRLAERTGVYDSASVAFSPDGRTLVTATTRITGKDDLVGLKVTLARHSGATLWDVTDRAHPQDLKRLSAEGEARAFSSDGRLLATGGGNTVKLWDVTDRAAPKQLATLTGHTDSVLAIALSPDGRTLATASYDQTVILWDVTDPTRPTRSATLAAQTTSLLALRFSPDGQTLTTADGNDTVTRWRVTSRTEPTPVATLTDQGDLRAAAFSPDSRTLAIASDNETVTLWDVTNATHPTRLAILTGHNGPVDGVAFNSDNTTLASAGGDKILLWDLTDRLHPRQSAALAGLTAASSVAFNPRGTRMAATGGEWFKKGWAALWDVSDRTHPTKLTAWTGGIARDPDEFSPDGRLLLLPGPTLWDVGNPSAPVRLGPDYSFGDTTTFSPDGRTLASARDLIATLWDISDPSRPRPVTTTDAQRAHINKIRFHVGGNLVATANDDGTAILWDVTDRIRTTQAATLRGHSGHVKDVEFSPNGRLLATISYDGTAIVWNLGDLPEVVANATGLACALAGAGITPAWWNQYVPGMPYQRTCGPAGHP